MHKLGAFAAENVSICESVGRLDNKYCNSNTIYTIENTVIIFVYIAHPYWVRANLYRPFNPGVHSPTTLISEHLKETLQMRRSNNRRLLQTNLPMASCTQDILA